MRAAEMGHIQTVERLLQTKVKVNYQNEVMTQCTTTLVTILNWYYTEWLHCSLPGLIKGSCCNSKTADTEKC